MRKIVEILKGKNQSFNMYAFLLKDYMSSFSLQGYEDRYCRIASEKRVEAEETFSKDPVTVHGQRVSIDQSNQRIIMSLTNKAIYAIAAIEKLGYNSEKYINDTLDLRKQGKTTAPIIDGYRYEQ